MTDVPTRTVTLRRLRTISGVSYPYFDLDSSIKVAQEVYFRGGGQCAPDQLAAWLGYSTTKSGTFNTRIAAARNFGLIQTAGGKFSLTERGLKIVAPVMPEDASSAKLEAFYAVELFTKIFEQFRGKQLPPEAGLKNLIKAPPYSVLADRVEPAVRVFLNSAEQAGFFLTTNDRSRLIEPNIATKEVLSVESDTSVAGDASPLPNVEKPRFSQPAADNSSGIHSAITGLLRELPAPGSPWLPSKKKRFLDAFKATIDFIYPEDDE